MAQQLDYRLFVGEEEVAHRLRELKVGSSSPGAIPSYLFGVFFGVLLIRLDGHTHPLCQPWHVHDSLLVGGRSARFGRALIDMRPSDAASLRVQVLSRGSHDAGAVQRRPKIAAH